MRGTYLARGELIRVVEAAVSEITRTGSGSATVQLLGTYRGDYLQDYLLEAETSGEVGSATFRWSHDQGQSWQKAGWSGAGRMDRWIWRKACRSIGRRDWGRTWWRGTAGPLRRLRRFTTTRSFGAPFEAITAVYLSRGRRRRPGDTDAGTGLIQVSGKNASVSARVVKDHTTHPVDMVADILAEVGLDQAIDQDSFALAKSLTPEYAIGVRFEISPRPRPSGRSSGAASTISGSISGRSRSGRIWGRLSTVFGFQFPVSVKKKGKCRVRTAHHRTQAVLRRQYQGRSAHPTISC